MRSTIRAKSIAANDGGYVAPVKYRAASPSPEFVADVVAGIFEE